MATLHVEFAPSRQNDKLDRSIIATKNPSPREEKHLSLAFDIKEDDVEKGWYNRGSIFIVVFLIMVVTVVSNLKLGRQFQKLFDESRDIIVDVFMTGEREHVDVDRAENPFLFFSTEVADGYARMFVASIEISVTRGKIMSSISHKVSEETSLQARLNRLTFYIKKIGLIIVVIVLIVNAFVP
ncbi:hypothetical protein ACLOJK_014226 [Asimina triloba]